MAKFTEETLSGWTKRPSDSEETKLENAVRMVKSAIKDDEKLKDKRIEIFGQGSYANNTNVRLNSDIDINVMYIDGFHYDLPDNTTIGDFGIVPLQGYTYYEFKNDVENALNNKFGSARVCRDDKCITIEENSYIVETDVVPTWEYRRYNRGGTYDSGAKFWADSGSEIENYPKQHIENGISKNTLTAKKFKRLTRLFRKIRYKMIDDGVEVHSNISSFLLECLVWNVPNEIFNENDNWNDRLKESTRYIYLQTKEKDTCKEWGEVSELLYLFIGKKWSESDVNEFMLSLWHYLEYKN